MEDATNLVLSLTGLFYLLTRMDPFGFSFTAPLIEGGGGGKWNARIPWTAITLKRFDDL